MKEQSAFLFGLTIGILGMFWFLLIFGWVLRIIARTKRHRPEIRFTHPYDPPPQPKMQIDPRLRPFYEFMQEREKSDRSGSGGAF